MQFSWEGEEEVLDPAGAAARRAANGTTLADGPIIPVYNAGGPAAGSAPKGTGPATSAGIAAPQTPQVQVQQPTGDPVEELQALLERVNVYKLFLETPFFENPTAIALQCEKRIKQLVSGEIETLLGRRTAQGATGSPFSQQEVQALKFLAGSAMKALAKAPPVAEEPEPVPPPAYLPPPPPEKKTRRKAAPGPMRARKLQAPPSFLRIEPAAPLTPAVAQPLEQSQPAPHGATVVGPGENRVAARTLSDRTYKVASLVKDEKTGEVTRVEKEIRLDITRQVRPSGITPAPTPVTQDQQDQINMRADIEATNNINLFARKYSNAQQ